ncbi:MAG: PQQ-binding-like beta-propeller repeat protein [Planctomycetota bacterium]|nr:PQQ-binding-like beta-propeller repeat protein [Planctomycetota bacterium]
MRSIFVLAVLQASSIHAEDWPMWRHDVGRTGASQTSLPARLVLKWSRELPPNSPAYKDQRLQFDRGYEPIVLGRRMFVASAFDDSVTAFDTETGRQLWKFFTDGPVRFAPVGGTGRVLFGSDDGHFYCVKASSGDLIWKFRAVPSNRRLLGNGRLISVWPVRGGPVLQNDKVYFAAGVWPLEGVFVYCLDAATGKVVWLNDRTSYLYGQHPHGTEGFGGLAPQGYLLIDGEDLIVPCSNAYPARFDLATGALKSFKLPDAGRLPGGWFASTPSDRERQKLKRRGLLFDKDVNQKRHEDKPRSEGLPAIRSTIAVGDRDFKFADGFDGISGEIHTMLAANGNLFVVTLAGQIACFGESSTAPQRHPAANQPVEAESKRASDFIQACGSRHGYAVVLGLDDPQFITALASGTELRVVGVDSNAERVAALRQTTRLSAERLSFRIGDPENYDLPKYFAGLIVLRDKTDSTTLARLYQSLRPFGGCLVVPESLIKTAEAAKLPGAEVEVRVAGWAIIRRAGGLQGAANYLGDWKPTSDDLVKAPLGVLWFDDSVSHFKRSPQPAFIDGVMVSIDKDWTDASTRKGRKDYRLVEPMLSDVYTGRVFTSGEAAEIKERVADIARKTAVDRVTVQPSQYKPPGFPASRAGYGFAGMRVNPLTGENEARIFPKRYGCDGGVDYGTLFTMRSATAAFYDKRTESGTINISGPRSGCTNSIIPANGLLNVPYFYEGCTCSYPLPLALSLASMPEDFEQWTSWGEVPFDKLDGKIQRLGVNLGAPGDRKTDDGTLWLNHPDVGGPSPQLSVTTNPEQPEFFYRHSLFMKGGEGWPWVTASGAKGLRSLTIEGLKPGQYSVRLFFVSIDDEPASFHVAINGQRKLDNLKIHELAKGPKRGITQTVNGVSTNGVLELEFTPVVGETVLCGVELKRSTK